MLKTFPIFAFVLLLLVTHTPVAAVTFDWVTVGNPNNPPDQLYEAYNPDSLQFGSVPYTYRISKYEVTNQQYLEFLNAVDPFGTNPHDVYNSSMTSHARGGIAFAAGGATGSKYSLKMDMGNKPVNYVSFLDSMRFVNWLDNGQPIGGSGTETGVYTIGNGINETRATGALYFIPNENEWYKAAYYQPAAQGGDTDDYWRYATISNTEPTIATANAVGDISNPATNVANYKSGADWNGQNGNLTTVGSAGVTSVSFYGTFDQTGNVGEWNEALFDIAGASRVFRGGGWVTQGVDFVSASTRESGDPSGDFFGVVGFRVASIVGLPGDFNHSGTVDAADYVAWRKNPAAFPPDAFTAWRAHFGESAVIGAGTRISDGQIPEPAGLALALAGLVSTGVCTRRRDRKDCATLWSVLQSQLLDGNNFFGVD